VIDGKNRPRKQAVAPKSNERPQSWLARLFNRPNRP
jgi:subfamily B ATP-binding cassette protein MsbA